MNFPFMLSRSRMAVAVTASKIFPSRRDEIGGDEGGGHFGSFGDDLKDGIGLFFGR